MKQYRYLWLLYTFVERETGNDRNEFHKFCKEKFAVELVTMNNNTFELIKSTSAMSRSELAAYIDKVLLFIEETFNIECPRPEQVTPEFAMRYGFKSEDFFHN